MKHVARLLALLLLAPSIASAQYGGLWNTPERYNAAAVAITGGTLSGIGGDTMTSDAAARSNVLRGSNAYPQATVNTTGGDTKLCAGIGRRLVTIVDYSLIDAIDTVTLTVNGSASVKTAGGTDWTAATSNAATAISLATALSAITGVSATASGSSVYITPASTVCTLTLATSMAAGEGTVTSGTDGTVTLGGTIASGTPLAPSSGGTGVANNDAATITRSGNHALTITTSGATNITVPTSGTLVNSTDNIATATTATNQSGGTVNATTITGSSTFNDTFVGPHAVGTTTSAFVSWDFGGTFASAATNAQGVRFGTTLQPAPGLNAFVVNMSAAIQEAASGTHTDFVGFNLQPPSIAAAGADVTNATTLKVTNEPTAAGATQRALWIAAGRSEFGGVMYATALTAASGTPNSICQNGATGEVTVNAALTCTVSSERFKNHIESFSGSGLKLVSSIKPSAFFYNDRSDRARLGLIAENLAKVDPRLAEWDAQGRPNSIDFPAMMAVMVKAIQEQQARIEQLEARITAMGDLPRGPGAVQVLHVFDSTRTVH